MNWCLAYNVAVTLGLIVALAWAFDARRLVAKSMRLLEMRDGPPTEEIQLPPTMEIGPKIPEVNLSWWPMEDLGPGKPLPAVTPKRSFRNRW
jgi:hypothetical protein